MPLLRKHPARWAKILTTLLMQKVFISHSTKDKRFVRTLKEDLNENNIETWVDEDQLDIGDSLIDKIESSLEESTHFLIILSPNSVNSDWVKLELNKAIKQVSEKLMKKIIPVQYRECEIPQELKGLLYFDLSKENVQVVENRVKFTTEGYPIFLNRIIKTIKSTSEKQLTSADKIKFREELEESEIANFAQRELIVILKLHVAGFSTSETKSEYLQKIMIKSLSFPEENNHIRPVLLPRILKNIFRDIRLGEELVFDSAFVKGVKIGHFAGFRRDDIKITIPSILRKELNITNWITYLFRFDGNIKHIMIEDETS